jgi:hypothetical protein
MPNGPVKQPQKLPDFVKSFSDQALGDVLGGNSPLVGVRGFVGTEAAHTALVSPMEAGVLGMDDVGGKEGNGVAGISAQGRGVVGVSVSATGTEGNSTSGVGVWGSSQQGEGVHGQTNSSTFAAIAAFMLNAEGIGAALHAENHGKGVGIFAKGGRLAGLFDGDVEVTGDVRLLNADCAEDFTVSEAAEVEPGTVMVIDEKGILRPSDQAYDRKVAGVISGAGGYKPGIILDKQHSEGNRLPLALLGKVYCKVDAQHAPVEVGDPLTTSPTLGHAMKAADPFKAFGSVIGKALRPLEEGQGLIPILVTLR